MGLDLVLNSKLHSKLYPIKTSWGMDTCAGFSPNNGSMDTPAADNTGSADYKVNESFLSHYSFSWSAINSQ